MLNRRRISGPNWAVLLMTPPAVAVLGWCLLEIIDHGRRLEALDREVVLMERRMDRIQGVHP